MIKMKNSLEGLHSRFKLPEESANLKRDQFSNVNNRKKNEQKWIQPQICGISSSIPKYAKGSEETKRKKKSDLQK